MEDPKSDLAGYIRSIRRMHEYINEFQSFDRLVGI